MLSQFVLWLRTFVLTEEEGQTMAEYALLLALIAIIVIVALNVLGPAIGNLFNDIADDL